MYYNRTKSEHWKERKKHEQVKCKNVISTLYYIVCCSTLKWAKSQWYTIYESIKARSFENATKVYAIFEKKKERKTLSVILRDHASLGVA